MVDARVGVVARRAAEQALAAGVDLPDDLALWRLAGGRPVVDPMPGEPEELGTLLEASFTPDARQTSGAHYTPAPLAMRLVVRALEGHPWPQVGDPACGGGALLLAAARHLTALGAAPAQVLDRLWGMDVDPLAVATAEAALALWAGEVPPPGHLVVADALVDPCSWPPLDVVVGNPPFLSQLDASTARSAAVAAALRARFGDAVRPYTDAASLFLLVACDLAAPGATVALLQPQSVLGARDASGVRDAVAARGHLVDVLFPADPGFAAAVDVCIPIIDVGTPQRSDSWSSHLARAHGVPAVQLAATRTLADEATTTAAFRSEYYGMVDHVHEQADRPAGRPLVTTGQIDLGRCAWGERPARIGRRTWERPVLDVEALEGRAADWARRTARPKLVVASQTQVVEVVVDEEGAWVPGVPLVVVLAPSERLWPLAAALASPAITAWVLHRSAGTALTPRALKVTATLLRDAPLPIDDEAWARGTDAFRSGDQAAFGAAMATAYGTGAELTEWWLERARERSGVWARPTGRISPTSGVARVTGSSNLGRTPKVLSHPSGWGCGPGNRATKCSGLGPPRVSSPR